MLKITFEIVPGGDPVHPQRRKIGHLNIGLQAPGQYASMLTTDGLNEPPSRVIQTGHDRQDGPFHLAMICLGAHLHQPVYEFVSAAEFLNENDEDTQR